MDAAKGTLEARVRVTMQAVNSKSIGWTAALPFPSVGRADGGDSHQDKYSIIISHMPVGGSARQAQWPCALRESLSHQPTYQTMVRRCSPPGGYRAPLVLVFFRFVKAVLTRARRLGLRVASDLAFRASAMDMWRAAVAVA
jgi:hypothetical protein